MLAAPDREGELLRRQAIQRSVSLLESTLRVRAAYRERPNLRLTPSQARRVSEWAPGACVAVLAALVDEGFLCRTHEALFVHVADQSSQHLPRAYSDEADPATLTVRSAVVMEAVICCKS
jgi:hypothetical protein